MFKLVPFTGRYNVQYSALHNNDLRQCFPDFDMVSVKTVFY